MKFGFAGVAVFALGGAIATYMFFFLDWQTAFLTGERKELAKEVFKFSVGTMIVGGAAVFFSALRDTEERTRAQSAQDLQNKVDNLRREENVKLARQARLETLLLDLNTCYNEIKLVRREMRHLSTREDDGSLTIAKSRYKSSLNRINTSQLQLETFKRQFESNPSWLAELSGQGQFHVARAENYLRSVVKEYEKIPPISDDDMSLMSLPTGCQGFLFSSSGANLPERKKAMEEFFRPLDRVFVSLMKEIDRLA